MLLISYSAQWVAMDTMQFYVILNRFIFGDDIFLVYSGLNEKDLIHERLSLGAR